MSVYYLQESQTCYIRVTALILLHKWDAPRSEYATREIPEYWIIDPITNKISVLSLVSGFYEVVEFTGDQLINSLIFSDLKLTANQIFQQKS